MSDSEEQTNRDFVIYQLVEKSLENLFDEVRQSMQTRFFLLENVSIYSLSQHSVPLPKHAFFICKHFTFMIAKKGMEKVFFGKIAIH